MPDDEEAPSTSLIPQILEKLNLPQIIAGPAGKAISRLIASSLDIPTAYLERLSQQIRDKTAAKQLVNKSIAEAAAKLAASDDAVVGRAAYALLAKEYRHQLNKETVAFKTLEHLEEKTGPNAEEPQSQTPVDDDWLNVFEKHAENASSERLQDMWSRVLAGEIRKPGTFSLKTLSFISELDQRIASTFEQYADAIIQNDFIPQFDTISGKIFDDLMQLQEFGLISGVGGFPRKQFKLSRGTVHISYGSHHALQIDGAQQKTVEIPGLPLTRVGREIYSLLNPPFNVDRAKQLADKIDKSDLVSIVLGDIRPSFQGRAFFLRNSSGKNRPRLDSQCTRARLKKTPKTRVRGLHSSILRTGMARVCTPSLTPLHATPHTPR
jgi:hypothetical protein